MRTTVVETLASLERCIVETETQIALRVELATWLELNDQQSVLNELTLRSMQRMLPTLYLTRKHVLGLLYWAVRSE
jgi:hypothetical protein